MIRKTNVAPTTTQVGGWYTLKLSDTVRVAAQPNMVFSQLCRPEPRFGPHMGDTLQFNKIGDMNNTGVEMTEDGDVPEGEYTQTYGTCTVKEYRNSIRLSHWASIFSELSVVDAAIISLTNEARKTLDKIAAVPFLTCDLVYTPTGTSSAKTYTLSTTGTAGATATREFSYWDHQNIIDLMRGTYRMPGFIGDDYLCVGTTKFLRNLRTDTDLNTIRRYVDSSNKAILAGEIGELEGTRFARETNAMNNSIGSGGVTGQAVYIAGDPVVMLEVYPFEIQAAVADMYGRFRTLSWVWFGGYARTWSWPTDSQARLIRVDSL